MIDTGRIDPSQESVIAHSSAFIAPNATIVGDVHLAEEVSVWFGTVIRGDVESIRIAAGANIQDLTMVHADPGFPTTIGEGATIGHRCIIHGATIGEGAMIGMGSILLNGCSIGARSLVGAGALVTQGKSFPPESLILGSPARRIRALTPEEVEGLALSTAHYIAAGKAFAAHKADNE